MKMKKINYVTEINDAAIRIHVEESSLAVKLRNIGAKKRFLSKDWMINFSTEGELVKILSKLSKLEIAFLGGLHGWPPSERIGVLHDEGKIDWEWCEITWRSPSEPVFRRYTPPTQPTNE